MFGITTRKECNQVENVSKQADRKKAPTCTNKAKMSRKRLAGKKRRIQKMYRYYDDYSDDDSSQCSMNISQKQCKYILRLQYICFNNVCGNYCRFKT